MTGSNGAPINLDFDHLSDAEVLAIWLEAADPEHPTAREEAALRVIEARNLDL